MPVAESLGAIASEFSRGFMQGRMLRQQQHTQSLQEKQNQIENLSRLSAMHQNNPQMRETVDSQLEQAIHEMEALSSGKTKTAGGKPGPAGSMFSAIRQFFGGNKQNPQAPAGTDPYSLMPEADAVSTGAQPTPIGPKPIAPNSQTYGDMGDYFGKATQVQPHQESGPSELPNVPPIDQDAANTYTYNGPPNGPVQTSPTATAVSASASPVPPVQRNQSHILLSPSDIRAQSLKAESTPKYGYYNQTKVDARSRAQATDMLDEALGMAEAAIEKHPNIKTFEQAVSDPNIGETFRTLLNYADRLEGSGLIEKGYVDKWKENLPFPDVRKGYVQPKRDDQMTLEELADRAYGKSPWDQTQQDWQYIAGRNKALADKEAEGRALSPKEALEKQYAAELNAGVKNGPAQQKMRQFVLTTAPPLQPPTPVTIQGINPATNRSEIMVLNRTTGKTEPTGIRTAGSPFIPSRFQTKQVTTQVPSPRNPKVMVPQTEKGFDADSLIAAHTSGDPSVSLETLIDLRKSGATMTPEDSKKLDDYIARQTKPQF